MDIDIEYQYQSINDNNSYTKDELEVANILVNLPKFFQSIHNNNDAFTVTDHRSKLPIWVSKKRRSGLDSTSPPLVTSPCSPLSFSPSPELSHNLKPPFSELKQWMGGIEIEERQERVSACDTAAVNGEVQAGASTSTQLDHPVPLMLPPRGDEVEQKKEPRGFDLNVPWVEEEEEEETVGTTTVEETSYAQLTKLNRYLRMMKLKQRKRLLE